MAVKSFLANEINKIKENPSNFIKGLLIGVGITAGAAATVKVAKAGEDIPTIEENLDYPKLEESPIEVDDFDPERELKEINESEDAEKATSEE